MNTFNFIYGISYMGFVALTFATGIGYYILRTGYVEMNDDDRIDSDEGCLEGSV